MKFSLFAVLLCLRLICGLQLYAVAQEKEIYMATKPIAVLKQTHVIPETYIITGPGKQLLVTIYPGKTLIKGHQYYILTFAGDNKRAAVKVTKRGIDDAVLKLIDAGVLTAQGIDNKAQMNFVKMHPVPDGYPDAELLNEYGKN